ncbi:MAG: hypothetical protein JWQ89_3814 [Devosia sp.]|uniref:hypothetical protein n=1 Tax=Devosia sp. TaxID=1871048 RepID=UPI00263462E5|nr:hypothetical protein [Devosia sp.]MDB5542087.1 hypothetical protein [Devosia sp.]
MAASEDGGVPSVAIIVGSIVFILLAGTVIWFAIPGISARHHFVSPSGGVALDIAEQCREQDCDRTVIAETLTPDGSTVRNGCNFTLIQTHPVLLNAYPLWAADERTVEIVYADAEGQGGKFLLDIAADCTLPE